MASMELKNRPAESERRPDAAGGARARIPGKPLSDAAKRALAEAEARRAARAAIETAAPNETTGRGGLDPTRYGDWEVKGIASDF